MHASIHILNTFQWNMYNTVYVWIWLLFIIFVFVILFHPYLILIMYYHANYVYLQMFMCTSGESATDMLGVCCSLLTSLYAFLRIMYSKLNLSEIKST